MTLRCTIILFSCAWLASGAEPFTEADAVMSALNNQKDFAHFRIDREKSDLALQSKESAWLPRIDASVEGSVRPAASVTTGVSPALAIAQDLPGGGTASASVSHTSSFNADSADPIQNTEWAATFTQPLLRNAWSQSLPEYEIRIERLDKKAFTATQLKDIAKTLSEVRSLYWNWYAAEEKATISSRSLALAMQTLQNQRQRFSLGLLPYRDTLQAALAFHTARRSFLDDSAKGASARLNLIRLFRLDQSPSSEGVEVTFDDLPPPEEILAQAAAYDPQRTLFEIAAEKLGLVEKKGRSELLPNLDFKADYGWRDDGTGTDGSLRENTVLSLIASYSLPTVSRRNALAATRLDQERNRLDTEDYQRELAYSVSELWSSWNLERASLSISETTVDLARLNLAATEEAYKLGTVSQFELQEMRNLLDQREFDLLQQRITLKRLELTFDEITGKVFQRFGVTIP